jgi:hypothetical protein
MEKEKNPIFIITIKRITNQMTKIHLYLFMLSCFFISACHSQPKDPNCNYKGGSIDFLPVVNCKEDFEALMGKPLSEKYGKVTSVKIVYALKEDFVYFIQSKNYKFHFEFCAEYLHTYNDLTRFNSIEYGESPNRKYVLANLNHYESSDIYTLEFFPDEKAKNDKIVAFFEAVKKRVYFKNKLRLLLNSAEMTARKSSLPPSILTISVDSIYKNQIYQPLCKKAAYGYLRKVSVKDFGEFPFHHNDIILTDGLPNDFPIVQGIITTCFQTPLCHINLLSANRGTPNAALKNAWNSPKINELLDKLVYYEVRQDTIILHETTLERATTFWNKKVKPKPIVLNCDRTSKELMDVQKLTYKNVNVVGGKAANFGELTAVRLPNNKPLMLPENAFAIPFFYYEQHIQTNHIQPLIDEILTSTAIQEDRKLLAKKLKILQDSIKKSPIDAQLLQLVGEKLARKPEYKSYRFRSSTNAEDIPGFNGAGLYDSKSGVVGDTQKTVEKAIKKVWASLWNLRAFEERAHFGIQQNSLAMGILVHRAFGTEEANGVAITRHLYRKDYPAFTINAQIGETSVVLPNDSITCDQFMINFSYYVNGLNETSIEFISQSSLNKGVPVLTTKEVALLTEQLVAIKKHFYYQTTYGKRSPSYDNFGLDVEFKFEKGTRKLYIKQARVF